MSNLELYNIKGGGYAWYLVLGGVVTFLIGVIDGYFRPLKCR